MFTYYQYIVLIVANAKNAVSQSYEVAKGVKFFKALVANLVYCSFTHIQNCVSDYDTNIIESVLIQYMTTNLLEG